MLGSRLFSRFTARANTATASCNRVSISTNFKTSGLSVSAVRQQQWTNQRWASTAAGAGATLKSDSSWLFVAAFVGANALYFLSSSLSGQSEKKDEKEIDKTKSAKVVPTPAGPQKSLPPVKNPQPLNYEQIYKEIADLLEHDTTYDDGSFGPILVRLAWHCSGTYDKSVANGGSDKATMRFKSESEHGGNAGLHYARDLLEKVHQKHPQISYGDLWTLAGVCAIQQMGGPTIPWRPGRTDGLENDATPDGRLPDGSKGGAHIRDIFYRMGFNDKDIVTLSGAHALGRCHTTRSGFDGPWTPSPTVMTNDYYKQLLEKTWVERKWNGPKQYEDKETRELMMLPTDLALIKEPEFKKWVEAYAKDEKLFFKEFSEVTRKLFELGVPFKKDAKVYNFKTI